MCDGGSYGGKESRRDILKMGAGGLLGALSAGVASANRGRSENPGRGNDGVPNVAPGNEESVAEFIAYLTTVDREQERIAVESLNEPQRAAVRDGLAQVEVVERQRTSETSVAADDGALTDDEERVSAASLETCRTTQNIVYGRSSLDPSIVLYRYVHTVNWCSKDGSITTASASATGKSNVYTWKFAGNIGGLSNRDADGYFSQKEGQFNFCYGFNANQVCIGQNTWKATSSVSAFPNGKTSKRGSLTKL